jgi:crossover junction endodeoxyribonuclease RuvC
VFVLGIDPGLSRCGYACVEQRGRETSLVAIGVLRTPPDAALPARLAELQRDLGGLIDELSPDVVSVERVFFQVNVRTAMGVGQASGLALAAAHAAGCEVVQYTPNEVKASVAGHGGAGKEEITRMVQLRLSLPAPPKPADAADAAALALCHLAHAPFGAAVARAAR